MCVPSSFHFFIVWFFQHQIYPVFHVLISSQSPINYKQYIVLSEFSIYFSSKNLKVLFLKLVNMTLEELSRMKLNKEQFGNIVLSEKV